MSGRYATQRSNRVRLKDDCRVLLGKLGSGDNALDLVEEIKEMMVRLKPPTGAAAPIVLTGYTQMDKAGKVRTLHTGGKVEIRPLDRVALDAVPDGAGDLDNLGTGAGDYHEKRPEPRGWWQRPARY